METHNNRNQKSETASTEQYNTTQHAAPARNPNHIDAQRGDNDDFTTNDLDERNTMGNDDQVSEAEESGTK